jgi:hypothetical protein
MPAPRRASSSPPEDAEEPTERHADAGEVAPLEIDVTAAGSTGLGGSGQTAGGAVGIQWRFVGPFSARVGLSERIGSIDVAQVSLTNAIATAGIAVQPWPTGPSRRIGLSARIEYLLAVQTASHNDSDDPSPVTRSRWLSGADAYLDVTWLITPQIGLLLGAGLEDVFSPTRFYVRDVPIATLPPLRGVGEGGFKLRF